MSTSIKIVLRKKVNKDGTYPLAIRITKDRKTSFVHLGHSIDEKHWDADNCKVRKSYSNSGRMNALLKIKLGEMEAKLLDLQAQKNDISSKAIKRSIKVSKDNTFFAQAEIYKANLKKAGKYNRLSAGASLIARFKEFIGGDITFPEITISLLNKYQAYLKARQVSPQTVFNHLVIIRTLFNQAIDDNIVDAKYYPFGRNKFTLQTPKTMKIGLTADEVKAIEQLDLSVAPHLHHARNIWLFSFYFAGMRVSDVFRIKWTDFQGDRLFYTMGKNTKGGSLKVPQKVLALLEEYKRDNSPHDLVFPELHEIKDMKDSYAVQKEIKNKLRNINVSLREVAEKAKITKKVTMHISRHTFGNISGDKIPVQMLQKLYRHSSITTTMGYQANFINKDADDALDAVIGLN